MKQCSKCGEWKEEEEYYKNMSQCKKCHIARMLWYQSEHKDECKKHYQKWAKSNKEKRKTYRASWYQQNKDLAQARNRVNEAGKKSGVKLSVYDLDDATWFALVALKKIERAKREAKKAKSTAEGVAISDDSQKDMEA